MLSALLGGLLVGAAYGYVAQRGAFCLNSGFRFVVTQRDFTKVKALLLAIAVQMVLMPAVFALGWAKPTFPAFFPVGAVLGGLLFGAAMYWAAGCAAGVWFKSGAGSLGALAAVGGMALGATAFERVRCAACAMPFTTWAARFPSTSTHSMFPFGRYSCRWALPPFCCCYAPT